MAGQEEGPRRGDSARGEGWPFGEGSNGCRGGRPFGVPQVPPHRGRSLRTGRKVHYEQLHLGLRGQVDAAEVLGPGKFNCSLIAASTVSMC